MHEIALERAAEYLTKPSEGYFFVLSLSEEVTPFATDLHAHISQRSDATSWIHALSPEEDVSALADALYAEAQERLLERRGVKAFTDFLAAQSTESLAWWTKVTPQWSVTRRQSTEIAMLSGYETVAPCYPAVWIPVISHDSTDAKRIANVFNVSFYSNFRSDPSWSPRSMANRFPVAAFFVLDKETYRNALSEQTPAGSLWRADRMSTFHVTDA